MFHHFLKLNVLKFLPSTTLPRKRPKQILNRPLAKYNLQPDQVAHLKSQGFLPKMDKRIRSTDANKSICPPNEMEITFLGTSAGKPTIQRNPSSLALRMDGQIWMFDCGEATTHQIMRTNLKPSNVTKIFITHLHGDHVLGLISFLSHIGDRSDSDLASENQHPFCDPASIVEIYGPSGIREFVRSNLRLTQTHSSLKVKINELLRRSKDDIYPPSLSNPSCRTGRLWHSELLGKDIWSDEEGVWKEIIPETECGVSVSAAPIKHTIPCIGYILTEVNRREKFDMTKLNPILEQHSNEIKGMGFKVLPAILSQLEKSRKPITFSTGVTISPPRLSIRGRRIMILGDTCNPRPMLSVIGNPNEYPIDLLIHEATGTAVPDAPGMKEEAQSEVQVAKKMRERGHSTSYMAGQFAREVQARRLVLNHVGGKFPAPMGCICSSDSFPSSGYLPGTMVCGTGLKGNHAALWKTFEEMDEDRQSKIKEELKWLKKVEEDAHEGWKLAKIHSPSNGALTKAELPMAPLLKVWISYDFMQIKIPRTDLQRTN
ncbi:hypothetical protein O181_009832 [Austropuccinia psidii MF-1]|uniref:Metallo-beta-lactamase domain-containing protein n=1 Tax=Austropuccinia psidii MF-1 TaxID=1389203 RepID=A0A9Q3BSJ8_9BASI|nr:hypothetical protein [Austropuccinia psidii MF-1]